MTGAFNNKTLLFVGGGIEAVPGIRMAKDMGLRVVVSDYNPQAPGLAVADERILASTYDVEATVAAAVDFQRKRGPIHGVMCLATDVPLTVASVAEVLGLPGIPVESARLAMDKLAMKERFARDGVPIPWFQEVASAEDLLEVIRQQGFPLVVKPVDSRGGRGVLQLREGVDTAWAFLEARRNSPTGRVMVERFLPGPQVSTESIVLNGKAYTPGFSDRNYEFIERFAPNFIENGGELPSHLPDSVQEQVREIVDQAAASLGIQNGVVKGDIVVSGGKAHVIELAARLSGGYFCTHEIPLNVGVSTVSAVIRLALGEPVTPADLQPKFMRGVAQRYIFPVPGRIRTIQGVEEARSLPGIEEIIMSARPGDVITRPENSNASAGMVVASAETREKAIALAQKAVRMINVKTEPL